MNETKDSIWSLFTSARNEQFVIPDYQRRFAWKEEQVKDLYEDIYYLNDSEELLLNMVIPCLPHGKLHTFSN